MNTFCPPKAETIAPSSKNQDMPTQVRMPCHGTAGHQELALCHEIHFLQQEIRFFPYSMISELASIGTAQIRMRLPISFLIKGLAALA